MSHKQFSPEDFGCLVRPKLLSSAFVLESCHKQDLEPWWYDAKFFERSASSSTYKREALNRVFGPNPFPAGKIAARISSMLLSAKGVFYLVTSEQRVKKLLATHPRDLKLRAVGLTLLEESSEKDVTPQGLVDKGAMLLYRPSAVVRLEDCVKHESLVPGDLVKFHRTCALVLRVEPSNRSDWTSQVVWVMKANGKVETIASGRKYSVIRRGETV